MINRSFVFLFVASSALASASLTELVQIRSLIDLRKVPEARQLLQTRLDAGNDDAETRFLLGRCLLRMSRFDAAVPHLEKASEFAPTNANYLTELGNAYLLVARANTSFLAAKKGRAALEKAVEVDPSNLEAHGALVLYFSRAPWIAGGDMAKAMKHAEVMRRLDPEQGLVMLVSLKNQQKKFDEALALCDEALRMNPSSFFAHYEIGRTANLSGKHVDRGIDALRKCLTLPLPTRVPNYAGTQLRLGQLLEQKGAMENARQAYRACLELDPANKQAREALQRLDG